MFVFVWFIGVVYGIALPQVPRTAAGGFENTASILPAAASTSASAAPSTILTTSAATLPSQAVPSGWVLIPDTIQFPCYLKDDCYEYTGTQWPPPAAPTTANWAGDAHLSQAAPWLVDPYRNSNEYGAAYTYDSICGEMWLSSLSVWMATAPTTLGPPIAASDVYEIVTGTTKMYLDYTEEDTTYYWSFLSTKTGTKEDGSVYTTTQEVDDTSPSATWASSSTVTQTITGLTSLLSTRSAHRDAYWMSAFTFTPSAPCCSSCTVFGGTVQVLNWPTPAPQPPVSILVDTKNNYTFTSPSVYVAFDSLYATNLCGTLGSQVYTSTTIAFPPSDLSTSLIYTVDGIVTDYMDWFPWYYTAITPFTDADCSPQTTTVLDLHGFTTFTDMSDAMAWSATNTEVIGVSDSIGVWHQEAYSTISNVVTTYTVIVNPCSPALSVPTLLYSLQPLWTGCLPRISAFYDPPYTLTPGGSMGLVTKTSGVPALPDAGGPTATPPKPGVSPKPGMPTSTSVPGNPSPNPDPPQNPSDPSTSDPHAPNPDPAPAPSAFIVAGQTLAQGAPPITMSGHKVSLAAGGSSVVIDATKTVPLASFLANPQGVAGIAGGAAGVDPTNGGGPGAAGGTLASQSGNAGGNGGSGGGISTRSGSGNGSPGGGGGDVGYVFGTQTLMPGSKVTVSGEVISLVPDGSSIVIIDPPTQAGSGVGGASNGGAGTTKTVGISALLGEGGGSTSTGSQTGSGGVLHQTGKSGVVGWYTGHDRLTWVLGALGGLWVLGLGLL